MSTDALPQPDPALLPDDPAVLKQLVVQLLEELQKANARLERQEHHIHLLLKRIYGSTSEKLDPRQGLRISRQTMDGWWLQTAEFLQPLYTLAVRVVLASHVLHTDDTSVKVRDA